MASRYAAIRSKKILSWVFSRRCFASVFLLIFFARGHAAVTAGCPRRLLPLLSRAAAIGSLGSDALVARAAAIADACAPDTRMPENTVCDASALCNTSAVMATRFICLDGEWRWTGLSSTFCSGWRHCVWEEGSKTLSCDGRIRVRQGGPVPLGVPVLWDTLLEKISIVHEAALHRLPAFALEGARSLRDLTVSSCMLTHIEPFALIRLRHLAKLDLSNNQLTEIPSNALPVVGNLRFVDVQGNADVSFAYPGLTPAMSYCGSGSPTLLPPFAGGCVLYAPATGEAGLPCHRVHCGLQRFSDACLDGAHIDERERCNGIENTNPTCPRGSCGYGLLHNSTTVLGETASPEGISAPPTCSQAVACLPKRAALYVRPASLRMKPALTKKESLCPLPYVDVPNHLYFSSHPDLGTAQTFQSAGVLLKVVYAGRHLDFFRLETNLSTDAGSVQCRVTYEIFSLLSWPDDQSPTILPYSTMSYTTLPVMTSAGSRPDGSTTHSGAGKAVIIMPLATVGALALVLIAVAFSIRLRQQRQHTSLLLNSISIAQAKIPTSTLITAEERFQLQFAPLLPADAPARYKTLLVLPAQLQIGDTVLGRGAFGTVCLGSLQRRGAPVPTHSLHAASTQPLHSQMQASEKIAIKMTLADMSESALTQLLLEARLHACVSHRNLVKLVAVQGTYLPVMLGLEYCSGGNLRQELQRAAKAAGEKGTGGAVQSTGLSEVAQRDMAAQVAAGLQYLHSKLCIHRDVAARNVLLVPAREAGGSAGPSGFVLKLADLGLSRVVCSEQDYYRSRSDDAVPIRWQCPMTVTTRVYTAKSDVYSFGVLLWEIYSGGATPFAEFAVAEVVRAVQAGARLQRPSADTPENIVALIRACTALQAASRPSMASVVACLSGAWTLDRMDASSDDRGTPCQNIDAGTLLADNDEDNETSL